jgi:hypothetical protein
MINSKAASELKTFILFLTRSLITHIQQSLGKTKAKIFLETSAADKGKNL